jgi:hypothetical protein
MLRAQESPKAPAKESNGTAPAADQNKTAPDTPAVVPAPPTPVPGTAEEGVPKAAANPKLTVPMPELLNGIDFGDFIRRNPFNLTRETDKLVEIVAPPLVVKPIVRLTGMTAFRGKKKVLLEIKLPGAASKPLYHTMEVGDKANGVKVVSIDPKKGEVKLDIKGEESTYSFDSEDDGKIEPFNARGTKGSGTGGRPSRGSGYNRRPTTPKPSGNNKGKGPLKNIPTRGNRVQLFPAGAPLAGVEALEGRPVFNNVVQTELIVATQINTQREFPRGAVANEPPTDLPFNRR